MNAALIKQRHNLINIKINMIKFVYNLTSSQLSKRFYTLVSTIHNLISKVYVPGIIYK